MRNYAEVFVQLWPATTSKLQLSQERIARKSLLSPRQMTVRSRPNNSEDEFLRFKSLESPERTPKDPLWSTRQMRPSFTPHVFQLSQAIANWYAADGY